MALVNWRALDEKDPGLHTAVNEAMDAILQDQSAYYDGLKENARAYLDRPVNGFAPGEWTRERLLISPQLTYNVIRSCTDTLTSNITLHIPATRILPIDATEGVQDRARRLEKLITGVRNASQHHALERRRVRDAILHGTGIIKSARIGGAVKLLHVHPSRFVVDDNAALDGKPEVVYHFEYVSRDKICALYGDGPAVTDAKDADATGEMANRDLVRVIEAHAVGLSKDKPGRRVICTSAGTLADEPHEGCLPYSRLNYTDDEQGFHGVGLAEILGGIQREINKTLEAIRENMSLMAVPYWLVPVGTKIVDDDLLTNKRGRKVEYVGNVPPRVELPPGVNPQVIQYLDTLYARAFELAGISQLSASSMKPAGLESGIALLNLRDVETQRFADLARSYEEQAGVEVPKLIVQDARKIGGNWSIKSPGKDFVESIKWADVSLDDDMFDIQLAPQSSLPRSPAGRAEYVIRLAEQQLISREDLFALLEMPDVSKTTKLAAAEYDDLERTFEAMLQTGEYLEPIEYQNLELGMRICLRYWSRARIENADDKRLQLLVRWMREAQEIAAPPPNPAAPPPMPEGMPPMPMPPGPGPELAPPDGGAPVPEAMPGMTDDQMAL